MITRAELMRVLRERRLADWVVVERVQDLATHATALRRHERRSRFTVIVHHDGPRGRGSARLDLTAAAGDPGVIVEHAHALAMSAIGEPWQSTPPAAPAKVTVLDPELRTGDLDARAAELIADATAAGSKAKVAVTARATVMREQVWVHARNGFHDTWLASEHRVQLVVGTGDRTLALVREERTKDRLELAEAIAAAARDLGELAKATAPEPGVYDIVLGTDAMLHDDAYGIWRPFVVQADSVVEHQGITRYRLGTPIVPSAQEVLEPLSITSDGAQPYAILSSPVGEEGNAIRKFPLVERGICAGLGMSSREAALRRRDPNGGVRNLVVTSGSWNGKSSGDRTLEIKRLRAFALDPITGDASLEILLARRGGAPLTGGTLRLDVIAALATARRSTGTVMRGPYFGPPALLISNVELIA